MSACKLMCYSCIGDCSTPLRDAYYRRLGELGFGSGMTIAENPFGKLRMARWWAQGWRLASRRRGPVG